MDMLHALVSGFLQCFNLSTFNLMMIGIAIGFVVGILPGLGGPTAILPRCCLAFPANLLRLQRSLMVTLWPATAKPAVRWEQS